MQTIKKLTIEDVLNLETGEQINSYKFFQKPLDELVEVRSELQKAINRYREPLFVCNFCKQKIRIRGGVASDGRKKKGCFHFAHLKDSEECSIKTNNTLTQEEVNRIKYNGAKESALHIQLKEQIAAQLYKNEKFKKEISLIEIEKVLKSKAIDKEWRKPDINAYFKDKRIAFELQLSTTWLSVITERQHFYKEQQIFILWVFYKFNINDVTRRLTDNDVIFTNHHNAFIFDEDCLWQSELENDLVLKCFYKRYYIDQLVLKDTWEMVYVTLSLLTFDTNNFKVYYHDGKKQKKELEQKIDEELNKRAIELKIEQEAKEKETAERLRIEAQKKAEKEKKLAEQRKLQDQIRRISIDIENYKSEKLELQQNIKGFESKIKIREDIVTQLQKFTDHTYDFIAGDNYNNPFYDLNEMVKSLQFRYSDQIKQIKILKNNLNHEGQQLRIKQAGIPRLEAISIGGKTYKIIPKEETLFNQLRSNCLFLYYIPKSEVDTLFATSSIKPIKSENHFVELFTKNNIHLMADYELEVIGYKSQMQENGEGLAKIAQDILDIKLQIKNQIGETIKEDIKSLTDKKQQEELSYNRLDNDMEVLKDLKDQFTIDLNILLDNYK
ncbi:DUF6035 family protein [Adhaeribacter aquaticus]|uniref:DUF6035 family protein n=1 Tax=Adhaeribacter aquaticus TaxID=299567 RepID=UPI0004131CA0|nr:DUF6035 family protein [Adhaeribacter aquaticus]